jgi:hypothetical protein
MPLYGAGAQNKKALFPEKSRQVCHALSIDGVNNYLCLINSHNGTIPLYFRNSVFHRNLHKLGIADLRFGLRKAG